MSSRIFGKITFLKLMYYFFKFCGLATIHVDTECLDQDKLTNLKFDYSEFSRVYNVLLIAATLAINYWSFRNCYKIKDTWKIKFDKFSLMVQIFSLLFSSIVTLVIYCVRQKTFKKIAEELSFIIVSLLNFRCTKQSDERLSIGLILKIMYSFNVLIWMLLFSTIFGDGDFVEYNICILLSSFFINCVVLQYSTSFILTFYAFRMINTKLQNVFKTPVLIKHDFYSSDSQDSFAQKQMYQFLRLRSLYLSLNKVTKNLSRFYGFPMLLCIYSIFITLTLTLYYTVQPLLLWQQWDKLQIVSCINYWTWAFLLAFSLVIVTKSAAATAAESERTGEIVFDCLNKTTNPKQKEELSYLLTYSTRKSMKLTVLGLFPLNESLLISILGSITTYLVIFLQFQPNNLKSNNENSTQAITTPLVANLTVSNS